MTNAPAGDPVVRLASRGDGLTATGAMVPGGVPGDVLLSDGTILPGPHRAVPPCRLFPRCGGCQLQHVDDAAYASFVESRVTGPLRGLVTADTMIAPPTLSLPRSRRRATLGARWDGGRLVLGFRSQGTHDIVDMTECWLLTDRLFAEVAPLRAWLARNLPRTARADVQLQEVDQGIDLGIASPALDGFALAPQLQALAQDQRLARLTIDDGDGPVPVWEPVPVTVSIPRADSATVGVRLPPGGFQQPTAPGEQALRAIVADAAMGGTSIIDLFTGIGTFALAVARQDRRVHGVEGSRDALAALSDAAQSAGLNLSTEHRDLFRRPVTAAELARHDVAIIDPPRAGAAAQCTALAASQVRRIIAVSCNPATLGRDAAILADGGFRLTAVHPVGQFRWSTHVEAVAILDRP